MTSTPSVTWNGVALHAIRGTRPAPTVAARALFMLHAAMFDAWAAYDPAAIGVHWACQTRRPPAEHTGTRQQAAMAYAAARVLAEVFPAHAPAAARALADAGLDPHDTGTDPATPAGVGNLAAAEVLAGRRGDGSNAENGYADTSSYAPVNTPDAVTDGGRWQPLCVPGPCGRPHVQAFVTPHWGGVTPFALGRPDRFQPPPPARWGTLEFLEQLREVLAYAAALTPTQRAVAAYWEGGPGSDSLPGHWTAFATVVSQRDGHDPAQDARLFLAVSGALLDASVACWDAKRHYDSVRPGTAVQLLRRGRPDADRLAADPAAADAPEPTVTPPSPAYPSAHSTLSAAAATALRLATGSDVFGHGVTLLPRPQDAPLRVTWATFSDAADEVGVSRRHVGAHFREGDLAGRAVGRQVGTLAFLCAQHHVNPGLHPTY